MVASDLPCLFGCIMTSLLIELQPLHAHMLQKQTFCQCFLPQLLFTQLSESIGTE